MDYGEQPEIQEPQIQIGETVWGDEEGSSVGKITSIVGESVIVSFPNRVSYYNKNKITTAFLPPFLVLLGRDEMIVHRY